MPGYAQTKFVSECILNEAFSHPFWNSKIKSITIYRPCTIFGDSNTGMILYIIKRNC